MSADPLRLLAARRRQAGADYVEVARHAMQQANRCFADAERYEAIVARGEVEADRREVAELAGDKRARVMEDAA
jgi:hypothetical protein